MHTRLLFGLLVAGIGLALPARRARPARSFIRGGCRSSHRRSRPIPRSATTTTSSTSAPSGPATRSTSASAPTSRTPVTLEPGADLMLLHPDGTRGGAGRGRRRLRHRPGRLLRRRVGLLHALPQPARTHSQWSPPRQGADIYKIHVKTRQDRPADQPGVHARTPARPTGRRTTARREPGKIALRVRRLQPGPVPAARRPARLHQQPRRLPPGQGLPGRRPAAVRHGRPDTDIGDDDDPPNVEKIGHLNLARALHPVVLKDGRIMFSSLESQGIRGDILWGIWTHPPRRHQLGPARQRLRPRRRAQRLPLPDAALRRPHRRRGVLQPEQQRLRHLHQAAADAAGRLSRRSARRTCDDPRNQPLALRPLRQRHAASTTACRSCRPASSR